jgi:hypothetical protein
MTICLLPVLLFLSLWSGPAMGQEGWDMPALAGSYRSVVQSHSPKRVSRVAGRISHSPSVALPGRRGTFEVLGIHWDFENAAPALILVRDSTGGWASGDDVLRDSVGDPATWPPYWGSTVRPCRQTGAVIECQREDRILVVTVRSPDVVSLVFRARRSVGHIALPGWKTYLTVEMTRGR